jgi:protein-S-isoprenylcysteine O-methyltransferase Ste14
MALPIFFVTLQLLWLVWAGYWIASIAYETMTNSTKETERRRSGTNLILFALLFFLLTPIGLTGWLGSLFFQPTLVSKSLGFLIAAFGVSFSIWARRHLGANWSGVPSLKKGHTLITSGPYSVVRHPIYTGILFGVVGSALVLGTNTSLIVIFLTILFVGIKIHQEEGLMRDQFGDEHRDYQKRVKTIIPWLL